MGKNKPKKWYANAYNSGTLRMVKASSEEEAREKFKEIFGDENFHMGEKLQHAEPKIPWSEKKKYYKAGMGIAANGEALPEHLDRLLDNMHAVGAI